MKGKFEKDIEQQLSEFRLDPPPQVWEEVEAVLHPGRKRRVIGWWWFTIPILAVAVIGIWLYPTKQPNNHSVNNPGITTNRHTISPAANSSVSTSGATGTPIIQSPAAPVYKKAADPAGNTAARQSHHRAPITAATSNAAITGQRKEQATGNTAYTNEEATQASDNDHAATAAGAIAATDTSTQTAAVAVTDTALAVKKQDTVAAKKTPVTGTTGTTAVTRKTKETFRPKHQWSIVAGGGFSLIKGSTLFTGNTNDAYYTVTPPSYPIPSANTPLPTAQTGFHVMGGLQYEHTLGRHWEVYTGLQYRYIQNNQQVGDDSVTLRYGFDNYFSRGHSDTKRNYSHQVELPVYMGYIVNPSARNQVQLLAGASFTYAVAEKWLIVDNTSKHYYYEPSLNSHVLINVRAGVSYSYHNLFRLALWAEQSLTPVHQVTDKYYRQQFSLQASIPLSTFKRLHTK